MRGATIRQAANAGTLAPPTTTYTTTKFLHATLPEGRVRDSEPCALGPDGIAAIREMVLPKLARGNVVLPARPRYRLSGSITAPGGCLFELRRRHGAGLVVARIGIGWRDHGASLVWAACARRNIDEPRRPWVVDALDAAGVALLNAREADRIQPMGVATGQRPRLGRNAAERFPLGPSPAPRRGTPVGSPRDPRVRTTYARLARERRRGGTLDAAGPPRRGAAREPNRRSESRCAPPLSRDEGGDAMSVFEDRFRKRTIEHVTLPEGASRAAARSQIDTDTLERIREDVLPALATSTAAQLPAGHGTEQAGARETRGARDSGRGKGAVCQRRRRSYRSGYVNARGASAAEENTCSGELETTRRRRDRPGEPGPLRERSETAAGRSTSTTRSSERTGRYWTTDPAARSTRWPTTASGATRTCPGGWGSRGDQRAATPNSWLQLRRSVCAAGRSADAPPSTRPRPGCLGAETLSEKSEAFRARSSNVYRVFSRSPSTVWLVVEAVLPAIGYHSLNAPVFQRTS